MMPKIFESPDKGETIYSRESGSWEKELVSESPKVRSLRDEITEAKMWGDIRRLAKTNVTLQDALNKVVTIYHLVKDRK